MKGLLIGAVAGLFATIPMTVAMKALHSRLPRDEQYPLPPRLIVESAAEKLEVEDDLEESAELALTIVSHYSYGAVTGAIYGEAARLMKVRPNAANGIAYGLGVWTLSYLAILPAAGISTPATEHPARRNALMIAAHIVWGAALGATARRLS